MANLIPQHIKRKIRREYSLRTLIAWFLASASVLLILVIMLLPTYIMLKSKLSGMQQPVESDGVSGVIEGSADIVESTREYVALLEQDTSYRQVPYGIFAHLFEIKTDAISFSRISFSDASNKVGVSGIALTRNDLKDFIEAFNNDTMFMPIENYPYESFNFSEDIPFTFDVTMKSEYE
jgi:hypothetical protein